MNAFNGLRRSLLFLVACLLATAAAGCGRSSSLDPKLEIRNFQVNQETSSYGARTYVGKGEVVVTEPALSATPILVFLKEKRVVPLSDSGQEVREDERLVLVVAGRGTISTSHYFSSDDVSRGRANEPKYEWTLVGWSELRPGSVRLVK